MAEDLTEYLQEIDIKVRWLHSDIAAIERIELLQDLRLGTFDVLVGVNLLREGLDLPEVSLVAIMEADKEGFLRAERSLIQTIGRAARNVGGKVILYADKTTDSMAGAISETDRRRKIQVAYNLENSITPTSIVKETGNSLLEYLRGKTDTDQTNSRDETITTKGANDKPFTYGQSKLPELIRKLEKEMKKAAADLDFETAAALRDELRLLQTKIQKARVSGSG